MLAVEERRAIEALLKGGPFKQGQEWLIKQRIKGADFSGWPIQPGQDRPSTWGGTVEALWGLVACGVEVQELSSDSIDWLVRQQKPDGSFGSIWINWPCVEVTAWVVIALRAVGYPFTEPAIRDGVKFIEACVQDNGGIGTSARDVPRIYSSAIALWAIDGFSPKTDDIAHFLKRAFNIHTGGWGFQEKSDTPNLVATTFAAMVLLKFDHLRNEDEMCNKAVHFITKTIITRGNWEAGHEAWPSEYRKGDPPNSCNHFMPPWVMYTLLLAGVSPLDKTITRELAYIVDHQLPGGGWSHSNDHEHSNVSTWCVGTTLFCLNEARKAFINPIVSAAVQSGAFDEANDTRLIARFNKLLTRENLHTLTLAVIIVYLLRDTIDPVITMIINGFALQKGTILANIVSSVLYAFIASVLVFLTNRFRPVKNKPA